MFASKLTPTNTSLLLGSAGMANKEIAAALHSDLNLVLVQCAQGFLMITDDSHDWHTVQRLKVRRPAACAYVQKPLTNTTYTIGTQHPSIWMVYKSIHPSSPPLRFER